MSADLTELIRNIPSYRSVMAQGGNIVFDPFVYTTFFSSANLISSAVITNQINIQADADFILLAQTYSGDSILTTVYAQATQVVPNVGLLLTDGGSGKQLSDNNVHVWAWFGNGQFPFILPQPRYFAAKSTLQVKATNFDTSNAYNLHLNFIGVKVYITS
jgi:hypothetical protein